MDLSFDELVSRAEEKINVGKDLIVWLENHTANVPGVERLQRKIQQEMKFLNNSISNKSLKYIHLTSSNLVHYVFLVKVLKLQCDVMHVDCVFPLESRDKPLRVDIVTEQGLKWVKVIARNSKSIEDAAQGNTHFGARSIMDQAHDYLEASSLHPCMFQVPKIVFYFSNEIDGALLAKLEGLGIVCASLEKPAVNKDYINSITQTLNLDITTLVAYISNMTNGSPNFIYKELLLTEQATREREAPIKPVLMKLFEGKELICCQAAYDGFQNILNTLGGPREHERANELLERVRICPNIEVLPDLLVKVHCTASVNNRSLTIFGFGVAMKAITVTSNKAFVQSVKMQGVHVPAFVHESRALSEVKEMNGTQI